jgi:hypothetical protein
MNPLQRDPVMAGFMSVFNPEVIEGIFYFFERLDQYEAKRRYDDNRKRFLEQALRLFEQGDMTKEQLKAVVDLLPDRTIEVKATPVMQQPPVSKPDTDINELLNKILNQ